jgi:basic amino acid/polyamine antiporter, APA family
MLAMARDGLVPPGFFGAVHLRFRTPWKSTILTGTVVGLTGALLPLRVLAELVNIRTLLAFLIVCAAVLSCVKLILKCDGRFAVPWCHGSRSWASYLVCSLMLSLPVENWLRLILWLLAGFAVYFSYGRYHSALAGRYSSGASVFALILITSHYLSQNPLWWERNPRELGIKAEPSLSWPLAEVR